MTHANSAPTGLNDGRYKNPRGRHPRITPRVDCHHWRKRMGKSTLVNQVFLPLLRAELEGLGGGQSALGALSGSMHKIGALEFVDQTPLASLPDNPVTYVKAFDSWQQTAVQASPRRA